ncbi:hypothetical protein PN470_06110 [Microcystis sp. CS-574]|uniref:hypothetical protein n=1 Tax=Microcystis sp. CS-574 TaxID=3021718 RepID=UPI00232C5340|nr:hypothetical protein [Microcystis sp. CS-574]MDB9403874.1 hypothetical protein [Microcystis sp. CS-574]
MYHSLYINVTTGEIAAHAQELFKAVEMGSAKQRNMDIKFKKRIFLTKNNFFRRLNLTEVHDLTMS